MKQPSLKFCFLLSSFLFDDMIEASTSAVVEAPILDNKSPLLGFLTPQSTGFGGDDDDDDDEPRFIVVCNDMNLEDLQHREAMETCWLRGDERAKASAATDAAEWYRKAADIAETLIQRNVVSTAYLQARLNEAWCYYDLGAYGACATACGQIVVAHHDSYCTDRSNSAEGLFVFQSATALGALAHYFGKAESAKVRGDYRGAAMAYQCASTVAGRHRRLFSKVFAEEEEMFALCRRLKANALSIAESVMSMVGEEDLLAATSRVSHNRSRLGIWSRVGSVGHRLVSLGCNLIRCVQNCWV